MSNISIKLNLQQLKHVEREMSGKNGQKVKCLIIPIEENNFFVGDKGTYLNLTAVKLKNQRTDSKDTHLVKQELPKEVYTKMTEEERRATPILGNAILWERREPDPVTSETLSESAVDSFHDDKEDDLPF